eukprot:Hpha_TRINITY_DN16054_c0_g1::TRINITY_DN16054_c0_g1_i10::g.122293::m.122293
MGCTESSQPTPSSVSRTQLRFSSVPHARAHGGHGSHGPAAAAPPPPATALSPIHGGCTGEVVPYRGSGPAITVSLRQLSGRTDRVCGLHGDSNVAELKRLAEKVSDIPPGLQKLVFGGRLLNDADSLSAFGIKEGAMVMLVQRLKQGAPRPPLQDMLDTYEITIAQQGDLNVLKRYDIVFLADDSGSMNTVETTAGVTQTRWKELQGTLSALIDFASYFDSDGTDIYFLNRPGLEGVMDGKDDRIAKAFQDRPRGTTPLAARLRWVVDSRTDPLKPLLVIVATDGEPDEGVRAFVSTARHCLTLAGRDVRLGVMACTQDDRAVAWLNELDDDPVVGGKVDVCDDFESERREVLAKRRVPRFLLSDYYMKAMLGPILEKYDNMD